MTLTPPTGNALVDGNRKTLRYPIWIGLVVLPGRFTNWTHCTTFLKQIPKYFLNTYEGVSKSFQTGRLEQELQMVQLSATRCSCIAILWVSLVSFAAITLRVASQRVFIIVVVYFVMTQSGNFWIHPRVYSWWQDQAIISRCCIYCSDCEILWDGCEKWTEREAVENCNGELWGITRNLPVRKGKPWKASVRIGRTRLGFEPSNSQIQVSSITCVPHRFQSVSLFENLK
jgi:hypothetical protein